MSDILSCTKCDKIFGNMVKLKTHIKIHHLLKKDLLHEEWADEEKLEYFNTLTSKLEYVEKIVKEYYTKYKSLKKKLGFLKNQPQKEVVIQRKKYNTYKDILDDPTIPKDWKSAVKEKFIPAGRTINIKVYWAPDGKFCLNRREALYYILNVLGGSKEDVELMKKSLEMEGWEKIRYLPKDWMAKRVNEKNNQHVYQYATPTFELCRNKMKALKYLLKNGNDDEISLFVTNQFLCHKFMLAPIKWLESKVIPRGWKIGVTATKKVSRKKVFISPEGHVISRNKTFIEVLLKREELTKIEVDLLIRFLRLNRIFSAIMKTKMDQEEDTKVGILDDSKYGLQNGTNEKGKKWSWVNAAGMSEGWKTCTQTDTYKDPSGQTYRGPHLALKFLKDSGGNEGDISRLQASLNFGGWTEETYIPSGWMKRTKKINKLYKRTEFLTDDMEIFNSLPKAISYMKSNNFSKDKIEKIRGPAWTKDKELPNGWSFKIHIPGCNISRNYINEDGIYFGSLPGVLKHMTDSSYSIADIKVARLALRTQGWLENDNLPPGWMYKRVTHHSGLLFLTNEYKTIKKKLAAKEAMARIGKQYLVVFNQIWNTLMN